MPAVDGQIHHQLQAWLLGQPGHECLAGMNRGIVHDNKDRPRGVDLSQQGQEGDEVGGAFMVGQQVVPLPGADVQPAEHTAALVMAGSGQAELLADALPHGPQHGQQMHLALVSDNQGGVRRAGQHLGQARFAGSALRIGLARRGELGTMPTEADGVQRPSHRAGADLDAQAFGQGQRQQRHRPHRLQVAIPRRGLPA